jgi:hypothetical protein
MKKCRICGDTKVPDEFGLRKANVGGYRHECKACEREYAKRLLAKKMEDPEYAQAYRERARVKSLARYKAGITSKPSPEQKKRSRALYNEKFPEKAAAQRANKTKSLRVVKGYNNHHWSYNDKHLKDVIVLTREHHVLVHKHIVYDVESKVFRAENGLLLKTKKQHILYINSLLANLV